MRKKFKNILGLILFLIIALIVIGALYFVYNNYFQERSEIVMSGPLSINYHNGKKLNIKKSKLTKITIINDSDEDVFYYIEFKNLYDIKNVKYKLTDGKKINIQEELNPYNTIVSSYIMIEGHSIQNFELSFDSKEKINYSLEINISLENLEVDTFSDTILKNSEVRNNPLTKVGDTIAVLDEGLIKGTDDYGTTYYYRGAVNNNYVKLGNLTFRIVRINGDGSVRLVLDGQTSTLSSYYTGIENINYKNTTINNYLNNWVKTKLTNYNTYLANQKYCNDVSKDKDEFVSYNRIEKDNIPSFICIGDKISSKAGLLTADEVLFAGASTKEDNKSFYLYNDKVESDSFLMTSALINDNIYYPFMISKNGMIVKNSSGENLRSIRPVITIIKTAIVTGNGTKDNPYLLTDI